MSASAQRIAVLLTCHNRREKTLACLAALFANELPAGNSLHVFLVDDGCTDGTAEAVREQFPQVEILEGDGALYWNGGMRLAFGKALQIGYGYYLWLNDDTVLFSDAIVRLLITADTRCERNGKVAIVVGTTVDPQTKEVTYGGRRKITWLRPLQFALVTPKDESVACDTINGNCVLIPAAVAEKVGNLDAAFKHTMGDLDYGLRAYEVGFGVFVAPGAIGTCSSNSKEGTFLDPSLSFKERFQKIIGQKNIPFRAWMIFARRHAGPFWPIYWLWPYIKLVFAQRWKR